MRQTRARARSAAARPSSARGPSAAPMIEPSTSATAIHLYSTMPWCKSVPTIASSIPSSPAQTPRRAVLGELIHFRERTKRAVAIRYATSIKMFVADHRVSVSWGRWL